MRADGKEQASQQRFRLRTEGARERDVFRHLHPWAREYKNSALNYQPFANVNEAQPEPYPCPDTALVAFAQLCALRLRARRCFVSLISSSVEYVLAESTRTMSLQYDSVEDPKDKAWLGTCSFPRDEGLNALALDGWRKAHHLREAPKEHDFYYTEGVSPHWQIVSDVRRSEQYAQRTFVKRNSYIRFYASVPLRGALGSVLGSLAIVDDAPRFGLSAAEMSFMEDIADTITEHLYSTVVQSQRQRSERLIQSLGLFNSGKSSLRHWWLKQEDSRVSNLGRHKMQNITSNQRRAAANDEFGFQESSSSDKERMTSLEDQPALETGRRDKMPSPSTRFQISDAHIARDHDHVTSQDFAQADSRPRPRTPQAQEAQSQETASIYTEAELLSPPKHSSPSKVARFHSPSKPVRNEDFDLGTASRRTYARASNLMREALSADGVVFINANKAAPETSGGFSTPSVGQKGSNSGARFSHSDDDTSDNASGPQICAIHAFSTMDQSSIRSSDQSYSFDISEKFLALLIRRYPQGRIFNFTEDGTSCSTSGEDSMTSGSNSDRGKKSKQRMSRDGMRLGETMAGARTIAFYPIWDEANGRWSSVILVWSTSPLRYFDEIEDITYLASWSHSVLAELGRLQVVAEDKAKGSFISSVSHELRSPLHGILGGVEFLQESELTSFQREMAYTISMAGHTLLDTVNHILDYSKISSFTRSQKRERPSADPVQKHHSHAKSTAKSDGLESNVHVDLARLTEEIVETLASAHRFQNLRTVEADNISLAINIPWRKSWMVELQAGGWTRILNNLVGNSLKYTKSGLVSVRIEIGQPDPADEALHSVRLIVQDTGIGMQKAFMLTELYTPFKQENPHSTGTGLGLSIVRQICTDIGAELKISSELGKGTRATVDLKVKFISDIDDLTPRASLRCADAASSRSRDLNVDYFCCITPDITTLSSPSVEHHVCETAKDWLGCEAGRWHTSTAASQTVVYAIADEDLLRWADEETEIPGVNMADIAKSASHVLVLARSLKSVALSAPLSDLPFTPVFVHQPIGPQKLLRAITSDRSATQLGAMNNDRATRAESLSTPVFDIPGLNSPTPMSLENGYFFGYPLEGRRTGTNSSKGKAATAQEPVTSRSTVSSPTSTPLHRRARPSASRVNSSITSASSPGSAISINEDNDGSGKRDTVLLVEDNDVNMKLLMALMRKLSLPHLAAVNGREALNTYRNDPSSFTLILMDMSMPIMDGFTATAKIRETERKHHLLRCPIVALTGVTDEDAKRRAFANGVDELFSKPVHMKEVQELMDRVRRNEVGGEK